MSGSKVGGPSQQPSFARQGPRLVQAGEPPGGASVLTVKRGDTLSAIAKSHGVSLAQLREVNPELFTPARRNGDLIYPGDQVVLPAKQGWATPPAPQRNRPQPPVPQEQLAAQLAQQQLALEQQAAQRQATAPQVQQPAPQLLEAPPEVLPPAPAPLAPQPAGEIASLVAPPAPSTSSFPLPKVSAVDGPPNAQAARAQAAVEPSATTAVAWTSVGELPSGPLQGSLRQGSVGDCSFVSALDSVLRRDPNALDRLLFKKDGVLYARFYEQHGFGPWKSVHEVHVPISDKLPMVGDRSPYLEAGGDPRPGLLEKAFAKWKGGYQALQSGLRPDAAFEALTGRRSDFRVLGLTSDSTFRQLAKSTGEHRVVEANSVSPQRATERGLDLEGERIRPRHAYGVVRAFEQDGQRFVELQNPWGNYEPGNDGKDDGRFVLDYANFERLFHSVTIEKR